MYKQLSVESVWPNTSIARKWFNNNYIYNRSVESLRPSNMSAVEVLNTTLSQYNAVMVVVLVQDDDDAFAPAFAAIEFADEVGYCQFLLENGE